MVYWYDIKDSGLANALSETVESARSKQAVRFENMRKYAGFYKDKAISGFEPGEFRQRYDDLNPPVTYNVIKSVIDALTSKITSKVPSVKCLTSGGKENIQETAKLQEKVIRGIIQTQEVNKKAELAFRGSGIYGHGILKMGIEDGVPKVSRIHPYKFIVDDSETDSPDVFYQKEWVSLGVLQEMYPKAKLDVSDVKIYGSYSKSSKDLASVYEAWKVGENGRHVICTNSKVLLDEEFTGDIPFAIIRYSNDVMGWYGNGIAEMLEGIQTEINETVQKIQRNMSMLAVPYILKPLGTQIPDEHLLTNEEFRLIEYSGSVAPSVETPPGVHPQVFSYLETLWAKAFEISGISQLSASGQKPSGLQSGTALRTYHDIESIRFAQVAKEWESLFVRIGKAIINVLKNSHENGTLKIKVKTDSILEEVAIETAELGDMTVDVIDIYPVSSLPQSPSGRLQTVIDMVQSQMIAPEEARVLLDFPDLQKSNDLANASFKDLEKLFEFFLSKKGKYIAPIEYQDLETGIKLGTSYLLKAKMEDYPEKKINFIERWIYEAVDLINPQPIPELPEANVEGIQIPPAGMLTPGMIPPQGLMPVGVGQGPVGQGPVGQGPVGPVGPEGPLPTLPLLPEGQ